MVNKQHRSEKRREKQIGVWVIYREGLLLTPWKAADHLSNPSVHPILFTQRSKGYLVHLSITQRVFQKVAYVRVHLSIHLYTIHKVQRIICQRMSSGPPPYVCTTNSSVRPIFSHTSAQKIGSYVLLSWRMSIQRSKMPILCP
jgi:hypothetical protein